MHRSYHTFTQGCVHNLLSFYQNLRLPGKIFGCHVLMDSTHILSGYGHCGLIRNMSLSYVLASILGTLPLGSSGPLQFQGPDSI